MVNYLLLLPIWLEESLMQIYDDNDPHGGQKLTEVKCSKLCTIITIFGEKDPCCKFKMKMTLGEDKSQMGSNLVNYNHGYKLRRSLMTMMAFKEVKGQQRSNEVTCR